MATSFRVPYQVYKRSMGAWTDGVYYPDETQGTQITVYATVQMPGERDNMAIEATPYGRRIGRRIKLYTDTRLQPVSQSVESGEQQYPGDIIIYDNRTYLIIGEADFTALARARSTSISHYRYYAVEMIEDAIFEGAP